MKCREAIAVGKFARQIAPEQTTGELCGDIAQQFGRHARIGLDDSVDLLDRLTLRPEFDRAKLKPLHEDVSGTWH